MLLLAPLIFLGSSSALRAQEDFKGNRPPATALHTRSRRPNSGVTKADIAILRGVREEEAGNLDAAEKFYKQALALAPNSLDAHLGLGDVESARYDKAETDQARQSAHQRGLSYYKRAMELDPTSNDAVRGLALLLWKSPSGGDPVLNDKAITLGTPTYPAVAKSVRASGQVQVRVLIDETGRVIRAEAINGNSLLRAAAVRAASESVFPPIARGQQKMLIGLIIYNFVLP